MSSQPHIVYTSEGDAWSRAREAGHDLLDSSRRIQLWVSLAMQDVASRYRGSIIGPWWITLSMASLVGGMGALYSQLMHVPLELYIPWLSCGIVIWGLINTSLAEGCDCFIAGAPIIRQTSLPISIFVFRTLARNLMVMGHNLLIVLAVAVIFRFWQHIRPLEVVLGLMGILANLGWIILICALASARFRDIPQVVVAALQIALFMTPVFWRPDQLRGQPIILALNPFYHMLEVVRAPLVGAPTNPQSWPFVVTLAVLGWLVAFPIFALNRRRIVHYL